MLCGPSIYSLPLGSTEEGVCTLNSRPWKSWLMTYWHCGPARPHFLSKNWVPSFLHTYSLECSTSPFSHRVLVSWTFGWCSGAIAWVLCVGFDEEQVGRVHHAFLGRVVDQNFDQRASSGPWLRAYNIPECATADAFVVGVVTVRCILQLRKYSCWVIGNVSLWFVNQ